ncbi:MAG TPA: TadE/TadG family type IV pilus assembly protein [Haliangiales bacterium]|nr:TadE/TadG family type IV pilus assembly protein [Haliangiales bacterium]
MRRPKRAERGVIAVELGMSLPVLLLLLLGGLHLARAIHARHRLNDAVGVATRLAAVAGSSDQGAIAAIVAQRMAQGQTTPLCTGAPAIAVNRVVSQIGAGQVTRLQVTATCALPPPFGHNILGVIGPSSVTATASMPLQ